MKNFFQFNTNTSGTFLFLEGVEGGRETVVVNETKEITAEEIQNQDEKQQERVEAVERTQKLEQKDKNFADAELSLFSDPEAFQKLPASTFLSFTPDQLQSLFLDEGTVDFRGNYSARRRIGAGDLFDASQKFIKVNGVVGQRSIDSNFNANKVGYIDRSGNYLPITGGEQISTDVSTEEEKGFEPSKIDTSFQYTNESGKVFTGEAAYREEFVKEVEQEEVREREMQKEMDEALDGMNGLESMEWKDKYVATAKQYAKVVENNMGIPYQVTLLQACLESGYGRHAVGGNHFGIKSLSSSENTFRTTEYFTADELASWKRQNPQLVSQAKAEYQPNTGKYKCSLPDNFRSYGSMRDSFMDYARFIKKPDANGNPQGRYSDAFNYQDDPRKFLETVIADGYATDPEYVEKADRIAQELGLDGWQIA